jgi:putative lipoic acid-binding regulatory protein
MKNQQETIFEFPCKFPIKIMANPKKGVEELVLETLNKHVENPEKIEFTVRESKTGKFVSITALFTATSKEQLNTLYEIFSKNPEVHMVL